MSSGAIVVRRLFCARFGARLVLGLGGFGRAFCAARAVGCGREVGFVGLLG